MFALYSLYSQPCRVCPGQAGEACSGRDGTISPVSSDGTISPVSSIRPTRRCRQPIPSFVIGPPHGLPPPTFSPGRMLARNPDRRSGPPTSQLREEQGDYGMRVDVARTLAEPSCFRPDHFMDDFFER